ncbi:MAG: AmmeMemoRadiSam system protein B, partial [Candidatus Aenigmarchaeota archaeon]|nr:AmmeMemoRadiSam system protein B [Candidatus Aenigmarchaeota archaeon]
PTEGGPGDVLAWMKETDAKVIDAITKMDVRALLEAAARTNVCGLGAIITMLYATMEVAASGALLQYGTSFHVSQSLNAVTSYAAIVME